MRSIFLLLPLTEVADVLATSNLSWSSLKYFWAFLPKLIGKSWSHQLSFRMAGGPLGKCPMTRVQGATPIVSFGTSRRHHMTMGKYVCYCLGWSMANLDTTFFTLPTARSASPVDCGWYGELKRGTHPISLSNSWVSCAVKFVPKSDEMYDQLPVNCHNSNRASQTFLAVNDRIA